MAQPKNRKILEDAFSEEDAGDWDELVKSKTKKPSRLRNPANSNYRYAEDRRRESKRPSGNENIWKGYAEKDAGYVYDDFVVDDNPVNPYHNTGLSEREQEHIRKKKVAMTPGDYTKNIGNGNGNKNKEEESIMDIPKSRRPRKYVGPGKGIEIKGGPITDDDFDQFHFDPDTGTWYEKPRKQNVEAKGIEAPASRNERSNRSERASNTFDSSRMGYITESGKRVSGSTGQLKRMESNTPVKRDQRGATMTTREGTFARVGSVQNSAIKSERTGRNTTKAAGGGASMRTGNSTRKVLEDGFRKDRMKKSFKGIKP